MNAKINVNSLTVEVTRRCNMACEHCLRGDAQNMDIDYKTIEEIARLIHPYVITFTGGEPSLNVPAIQYYFEMAEKYGNLPGAFYVVTNGKENQTELALTLLAAYPKCEDKEYCGVCISQDIFHDEVDRDNSIMNGLSFYRPNEHVQPLNEYSPEWVINEGRAQETGWGCREETKLHQELPIQELLCAGEVYMDELHIAANGLCTDSCDASYENTDANYICHISELEDAVDKWIEDAEQEEVA